MPPGRSNRPVYDGPQPRPVEESLSEHTMHRIKLDLKTMPRLRTSSNVACMRMRKRQCGSRSGLSSTPAVDQPNELED